jgi:hypothetical protein
MNRFPRARHARFAVIAGALTLVFSAAPAAADSACSERVLADWSRDERIDRLYALSCYEEAIEALPADIRDYTDASEVIERAQARAVRARQVAGEFTGPPGVSAADAPSAGASSFPAAPLVGGAVALAVVLAGGVAYLARRRGPA